MTFRQTLICQGVLHTPLSFTPSSNVVNASTLAQKKKKTLQKNIPDRHMGAGKGCYMGCHSLLALFCVSCQPTGIVGAHVRMCSAPAKPCRHKKIKTATIESMDTEGSEFSSYILEPRPKMPSKHNAHSFISQELQWLYAPRTNILLLWLRSIKHIKEHLLDNGVVSFIFYFF